MPRNCAKDDFCLTQVSLPPQWAQDPQINNWYQQIQKVLNEHVIKVNAADVSGYLEDKLTAGDNITLATQSTPDRFHRQVKITGTNTDTKIGEVADESTSVAPCDLLTFNGSSTVVFTVSDEGDNDALVTADAPYIGTITDGSTSVSPSDYLEFVDTSTAAFTVNSSGSHALVHVDVDADGDGSVTETVNNFWSNTFGDAYITEFRVHYKQNNNYNTKKLVMPLDATIDWRFRNFVAWLTMGSADGTNSTPADVVGDVYNLPGTALSMGQKDGFTGPGSSYADLSALGAFVGGWVAWADGIGGGSDVVTIWVSDGTAEKGASGGGTDWLGSDPEAGNLTLLIEDALGGLTEFSFILTVMVGDQAATDDEGPVPNSFLEIGDGH